MFSANIKGYTRILKQVREGTTQRHRKGECALMKRRFMKLVVSTDGNRIRDIDSELEECHFEPRSKSTKRRKQDDQSNIEAVIYIPYIPDSNLKQWLNQMETQLGFKTRVKYEEEL